MLRTTAGSECSCIITAASVRRTQTHALRSSLKIKIEDRNLSGGEFGRAPEKLAACIAPHLRIAELPGAASKRRYALPTSDKKQHMLLLLPGQANSMCSMLCGGQGRGISISISIMWHRTSGRQQRDARGASARCLRVRGRYPCTAHCALCALRIVCPPTETTQKTATATEGPGYGRMLDGCQCVQRAVTTRLTCHRAGSQYKFCIHHFKLDIIITICLK